MNTLEKILICGIRRMWWTERLAGRPIVLKGSEGIILRDLLQVVANIQEEGYYGTNEHSRIILCGELFFCGSPIYCECELPIPELNTYHGYIS